MRLESLHRIPVIKDIMPKLPMDEDYVIINESISFEPTDEYFAIGGKEFHEEGKDVYNIYNDGVHIGMLAIEEYLGEISLDGLEIFKEYRKQGFGKKVVDLLKKKYKGIYVRAIPSAKKFWKKQGHKAYYNRDSGTWDGDLIYDFDESKLNESIKVVHMDDDRTWFGYGNYPNKVGNDGIRIIYGISDFKSYCQKHDARVIYDIDNNYFIVADVYNYAHIHIEEIFQDNGIKISDNTYHFKTQVTTDNEEPVSYDRYRYRYDFGSFIIYTRDRDIENLPILNDLGNYKFTDLKNNISESIKLVNKDYADTRLITTPQELNAYLKNNTESRVVYDIENNWFLVGNTETSIHIHLLNDAMIDGYYEPFEYNGQIITGNEGNYKGGKLLYEMNPRRFVLFRTSQDPLNGEDYYYDRYSYCYYYNDYCVFDRNANFEQTPLYKLLGEPLEIENIGDIDEDEGLNESVTPEQVPEKLYHATFSKLLRKIKRCGYLGNSPYKLWSDSNNKYVYLATDPDEAYSYAETALDDCDNERLYDMLEDDDIVILEIDTKYLDKNKIFRDENVVDGETTYQYEGIINCQIMKIYKPSLNEELIYAERSDDYYDDSEYQDMTNVILKNPSRKELIDNGMIECRIVKDYKDNFYFANSYEMIHTDIVDKLESENITSVETNLFYDVNSNTFYYNVGHLANNEIKDFSQREEQMLRTSSYVSKTFKNFKFKLTYGEM